MSTFDGLLDGIPSIAVDRFDGENSNSSVFFISHCHSDHMVGLCNLKSSAVIYCSDISALFIKTKYPQLENIFTLEIEYPLEINYIFKDHSQKLTVTAIRAEHCPGSIMFLFENQSKRILYTGDFRLTKNVLDNCKFIIQNQLDTIYLDSTFLSKHYMDFPPVQISVNTICNIIDEWLLKGDTYEILLDLTAMWGFETLLITINQRLKQKTHVTEQHFKNYIHLASMDNCYSRNASLCRVHINVNSKNSLRCCESINLDKNVRTIRPSALSWKYWNKTKQLWRLSPGEKYNVLYSNHCSYREIKAFLATIQTKSIKLNVLPNCHKKRLQINENLNELRTNYQSHIEDINIETNHTLKLSNIKSLKHSKSKEFIVNQLPKRRKL